MITIDQLWEILSLTVFHPKGAWSLFAIQYFNRGFRANRVTLLLAALAILVSIRFLLGFLNKWLINAQAPRKLDPKSDRVVVTGGSRGLGLLVCALYSSRGIRVANWDYRTPPIDLAHITHIKVDISDPEQVLAAEQKTRALVGVPSVVVLCAGVAVGGSLADKTVLEDLRTCLATNVIGTLAVARAFLPDMLTANVGNIIAISSSTALAAPAKAGVYASSKAALACLFESLRHELRNTGICVTVVTPGQLDTDMFAKVKTPNRFLAPVISGVDLARHIVEAVDTGRRHPLCMPLYTRLLPLSMLLPEGLVDFMRDWIGVDRAMDTFEPAI